MNRCLLFLLNKPEIHPHRIYENPPLNAKIGANKTWDLITTLLSLWSSAIRTHTLIICLNVICHFSLHLIGWLADWSFVCCIDQSDSPGRKLVIKNWFENFCQVQISIVGSKAQFIAERRRRSCPCVQAPWCTAMWKYGDFNNAIFVLTPSFSAISASTFLGALQKTI